MRNFQLSIFYDLQDFVQRSDFHRKYFMLFSSLDLSGIPDKNYGIGRTGHSRHAMIRAFIVKHLEGIPSVPRLIEFLDAHPVLTDMSGFEKHIIPDESQFYRFLKETRNSMLEKIHIQLNRRLVEEGIAPAARQVHRRFQTRDGRNEREQFQKFQTKHPRQNQKTETQSLGYFRLLLLPGGPGRKEQLYLFLGLPNACHRIRRRHPSGRDYAAEQ